MPGDVEFHYRGQSITLTANNRTVLEALVEEFCTLTIAGVRPDGPSWHTLIHLIAHGHVTLASFTEIEDDGDSTRQQFNTEPSESAAWRLRRHKWRTF